MKNLDTQPKVAVVHETIRENQESLPTMIEYYKKNSKRLDELTKIIIINSLLKSALDNSMIFPIQRKIANLS